MQQQAVQQGRWGRPGASSCACCRIARVERRRPLAPLPALATRCAARQVVIDISKHAVLGKFNDIRPGIYREYMRDLCSDSLDNHSHNIHKLVSGHARWL